MKLFFEDKNLRHKIKSIISCNKFLALYTIKNKIRQLLFKYEHKHEKKKEFSY